MKKLLYIFCFLCGTMAWAQPPHLQERVKEKKAEIEQAKKEIITARISLKPEQEKNFWEVYDKYIEERIVMRKKITRLHRTAFTMTASDAELEKSFEELHALRQKELDTDKNYRTLLLKIINIRQLAELHRCEKEFLKRVLDIMRDRPAHKPVSPKHDREEGDD